MRAKTYALGRAVAVLERGVRARLFDSSPGIGADGTVYVGSCDGRVYALVDSSTGGLQPGSLWPMFHGIAQHTGWVLPAVGSRPAGGP